MRRVFWISMRRLKVHEFQSTLRHVKVAGDNWATIYLRLGELNTEATKRIVKYSSSILLFYLMLRTLGNGRVVGFTFEGISASIPIVFATLAAAVNLFMVVITIQTFLIVVSVRSRESAKVRTHRFHTAQFGFYRGQDEFELSLPFFIGSFFRPWVPIPGILASMISVVLSTLLLPLLGVWYYLLHLNVSVLNNGSLPLWEYWTGMIGLFVLAASPVYVFFFNIPIPMKKFKTQIR